MIKNVGQTLILDLISCLHFKPRTQPTWLENLCLAKNAAAFQ